MKLVVEQIDLQKTREHWPHEQPFAPASVKSRKQDKSKWIVLSAPFVPGTQPSWAYTEHDEYIRVPLFPYALSPHGDLALAFMLQMGLSCAGHLPNKLTGFYVVTGRPVELLTGDADDVTGMRFWVGFAVTTE
jgi:hypothetical protein